MLFSNPALLLAVTRFRFYCRGCFFGLIFVCGPVWGCDLQTYMIKWPKVYNDTSAEYLLDELVFDGPVDVWGLQIHAHPDTDWNSISEIYVMRDVDPSERITPNKHKVIGMSMSWTERDPFRTDVIMLPHPIRVEYNIVVRAHLRALNTFGTRGGVIGRRQNETGEVLVYYCDSSP